MASLIHTGVFQLIYTYTLFGRGQPNVRQTDLVTLKESACGSFGRVEVERETSRLAPSLVGGRCDPGSVMARACGFVVSAIRKS